MGLSVSRFQEVAGDEFRFYRFTVDLRQYVPLGSRQRVLAARFFTSLDQEDSGRRVPFFLLQTLGGADTLRGFEEMRFRDRRLILLAAEYRWEATSNIEVAVFYDAGKAFSDSAEYDLTGLNKSVGWGLRMKTPGTTLVRFDVARSREGTRIHFRFGPSF